MIRLRYVCIIAYTIINVNKNNRFNVYFIYRRKKPPIISFNRSPVSTISLFTKNKTYERLTAIVYTIIISTMKILEIQKLITDLENVGLSQKEIASGICKNMSQSTVCDLKKGKLKSIRYERGVALLALHKKHCSKQT